MSQICEGIVVITFIVIVITIYILAIFKPTPIILFLALFGILCFLYGYFIEPYWVEVKTVDIFTDKLKHTELKVVHISDLHCDNKVRNEHKLLDIINPLKPDIVVFTGDSINLNMHKAVPRFKDIMNKLNAGIGKFAVKGNIDWYWRNTDLFDNIGFRMLKRESVKLTKGTETFFISGLNFEHRKEYHEVLKNIPSEYYSIFLFHTPGLIEDLKEVNVDLYLAGHTHGGQIALPFYGALVTLSKYGKKYEAGKYVVGKTTLYINRGIGMDGAIMPRVRFCARPEITIFNIKPKKR